MTAIPFIQYIRPNGRAIDVTIERPATIGVLANKLIAAGYRFECEVLMDNTVSLTISRLMRTRATSPVNFVQMGPKCPRQLTG